MEAAVVASSLVLPLAAVGVVQRGEAGGRVDPLLLPRLELLVWMQPTHIDRRQWLQNGVKMVHIRFLRIHP